MNERTPEEDIEALVNGFRKRWKPIVGGIAATTLGVWALWASKEAAFDRYVRENPPQGVIAYSIDNQIRWVGAKNVPKSNKSNGALQTKQNIEKLLWFNDKEVIYVSSGEGKHYSHHVYKANIKTGKITPLFDPYDKGKYSFFGDRAKLEREAEEKFDRESARIDKERKEGKRRGGIRIYFPPKLRINKISVNSNNNLIYLRIGKQWYTMNGDGNGFTKPNIVPSGVESTQLQSPTGKYKLSGSQIVRKDGGFFGLRLEYWARNAAWRK